jgi:hypothetical protein
MDSILDNSRKLINEHTHLLNLGRRVKSQYLLTYPQDKIDFFDSDYDHLYDIYKTNWEWGKEWGNAADGLEDLVKTMEKNNHLAQIRLTSFSSKIYEILLFSDPDYTIFLGLLIFPPLEELYRRNEESLHGKNYW